MIEKTGEKMLDIRDLLAKFKKKFYILILTTIVGLGAGIYLIKDMAPSYLSSTKIFVGKNEQILNVYSKQELETNGELVNTYSELMKVDDFLTETLKKYNINESVGVVKNSLNLRASTNSPIITINYIGSDMEKSKYILDSISKAFLSQLKSVVPDSNAKVIDSVKVTEIMPSKVKRLLLGSGVGFIIGVIIVFMMYYVDDTINNKDKIEDLTKLPLIGEIPMYKKTLKSKSDDFILKKSPYSIATEAYRNLRTNLRYSSIDKTIKSIAVTSSEPGEGKSSVAGNLALSLAQNGSLVIVIDCDLRRPSLHRKFGISNSKGITDVLIGNFKVDEVISVIEDRIYMVPAGPIPPNPSEMLGSKSFQVLIDELKKKYDYVIIDTPPVRVVTDAQIISAKADGTLLVVRSGISKEKQILDTLKELRKVNSNMLGIVLNGSEEKRKAYYSSYYYEGKGKKNKAQKVKQPSSVSRWS